MGIDHTITVSQFKWPKVTEESARRGVPLQLRMIDNLPAFPDEAPPDDWAELRVSTLAGMITLRRVVTGIQLVIWDNAEPALVAARDTLADAIAAGVG